MPKRRQTSLMFAPGRHAKRRNSARSDIQVLSLQGIGPPVVTPRQKCYLCPRTPVTYVSGPYRRERVRARVVAPLSANTAICPSLTIKPAQACLSPSCCFLLCYLLPVTCY